MSSPSSLALTATMLLVAASGCAPEPKHLPCRTDVECRERSDSELEYCLESRCVECLGQSMCSRGEVCIDGRCQAAD